MKSIHPPADFHDRYACLLFGNWVKEFSEIASKETAVWVDAVSGPPMFGGTTLKCEETFGASAFKGTLEHAAAISDGWEFYADDSAGIDY